MSKIEFINQMEPWFGLEEQEALNKYMGEGGWVTEFKKTFEFQDLIKKYTGAKHCFVVNNKLVMDWEVVKVHHYEMNNFVPMLQIISIEIIRTLQL